MDNNAIFIKFGQINYQSIWAVIDTFMDIATKFYSLSHF
ncbi:hypothetical protein UNSW2_1377 [Campylobacter concisus UNSW2]|uniref:Uncharacterized protein n=1 Tax=Campylobacter concisus UNSW2 TaxID=1242965 RepID=U2FL81_9BACT|nr:hypothetical protein UNSW2_1377 [Campylobacter concisus UNSW2]